MSFQSETEHDVAGPSPAETANLLFRQILEQAEIEIGSVLADMSSKRPEARRIATRDLRFEPSEAEFQAMLEIVDNVEAVDSARDLSRRLLALRVLGAREIEGFLGSSHLDPDGIRRSVSVVLSVLETGQVLDRAFEEQGAGDTEDAAFLRRVGAKLALPYWDFASVLLLAPRLELFHACTESATLRSKLPHLTERDAGMIRCFVTGEGGDPPPRVCIDALALKTIIAEDVAALQGFLGGGKPHGNPQVYRKVLRERLERDRDVHQRVFDRLKTQQDVALVAGLESLVATLEKVRASLFESYRRLVAALRALEEPGESRPEPEIVTQARPSYGPESSLEPTPGADPRRTPSPSREPEARPSAPARRERRSRLLTGRSMLVIGALVAMGAWVVHHNMEYQRSLTAAFDAPSFTPTGELDEIQPMGSLLYARFAGWSDLGISDRRAEAGKLIQLAENNGFRWLFLVDEMHRPAGLWSAEAGLLLTETTGR